MAESVTDLTPAQLAEKINLVMFYDELTEDDWPAAVAALSELRARATALDAERTRNRELEQFGTIRSRREAEARAKNAEAALDAERTRTAALTQQVDDHKRVIEKRAKEIDSQMRRAEQAESLAQQIRNRADRVDARLANLEAVAEAAQALNAAHGDLLGLPTLSRDELDAAVKAWAALRAALAVLEEPQ